MFSVNRRSSCVGVIYIQGHMLTFLECIAWLDNLFKYKKIYLENRLINELIAIKLL